VKSKWLSQKKKPNDGKKILSSPSWKKKAKAHLQRQKWTGEATTAILTIAKNQNTKRKRPARGVKITVCGVEKTSPKTGNAHRLV